jgi:alanyl-tRNA synthetase
MRTQLLYLNDSSKLEFEAMVERVLPLPGGRCGAVLDGSYFYPTGGGQAYDTGFLGERRVLDVYKDEQAGEVVHVLDGEISPGLVSGRIDAMRRLRHMQHHTAQHLLTQCFLQVAGLDTVSAHISGDKPSSFDLPAPGIDAGSLARAEELANQVVFEDRAVKGYFVTPQELSRLPVRRPPSVSEDIRIVEIDGFDHVPCGGTHCTSTGMLGLVKVVRQERQGEQLRISFVAGWQALDLFRQSFDTLGSLAAQAGTAARELPALFERQSEQLRLAQHELQALHAERVELEAGRLAQAAETCGGKRVALAALPPRPGGLRPLGEALARQPGLAAVLGMYENGKVSLLVACAPDSGVDARRLLQELLAPSGGRGGGSPGLAQGGFAAPEDPIPALLAQARASLCAI